MNDLRKDKHAYFKFIASRRVNKILEQLRLLRNCSNRNNYAFTNADLDKIFKELKEQTKKTEMLLRGKLKDEKSFKFTLQ